MVAVCSFRKLVRSIFPDVYFYFLKTLVVGLSCATIAKSLKEVATGPIPIGLLKYPDNTNQGNITCGQYKKKQVIKSF